MVRRNPPGIPGENNQDSMGAIATLNLVKISPVFGEISPGFFLECRFYMFLNYIG